MKPSELIDTPEKWMQGCPGADLPYCIMITMDRCSTSGEEFKDWLAKLRAYLDLPDSVGLAHWNDAPLRIEIDLPNGLMPLATARSFHRGLRQAATFPRREVMR